jgi:aspartate carbamoyltransferase catalytic subunit
MKGRDIITIKELNREEMIAILDVAEEMKKKPPGPILRGNILASCFFEPSTRTRLSFESAMKRLGGDVIGFSETTSTSTQKGEALYDAMKIMGYYADVVVVRHPLEGSARVAAEACDKPVINGGDGANEHPSQTLLDLFTIRECQGRLNNLNIAFVGDLLYGRTVHSLAPALGLFDNRFYFVSPPQLAMPESICRNFRQQGIPFSFHQSTEEIIDKADILYVTRIQKERFTSVEEYLRLKDHFVITPSLLGRGQKHLKVLHPLPRVKEIEKGVDATPYAYYFPQAENGLWVRQALLKLLLLGA